MFYIIRDDLNLTREIQMPQTTWTGYQIRDGRNLLRLTQAEFAKILSGYLKLHISQVEISQIERSQRRRRKLLRIATEATRYLISRRIECDATGSVLCIRN
jgi:hypothetical protein